jgi:hypothetical protein
VPRERLAVPRAPAGESITLSVDHPGTVRVDTEQAGPGCTRNEPLEYTECPLGPGGVRADMGGGNDSVFNLEQSSGGLGDGVLRVDLGAGDDVFDGDHFNGIAADLIDGGPGMDRAEGWADPSASAEHPPISITLDGVADDGRPGEGDDVRSIERLTSNVSGTLVLSDEPDQVVCGPGTDVVKAGAVDALAPDCETADRAGATPPATGPAGPAQKPDRRASLALTVGPVSRRAALRAGIRVTLIAPAAGRVSGVAGAHCSPIAPQR